MNSSVNSTAGLESLMPIIEAKGGNVSPAEFQASINRVFHSHESAVYDRIHKEMKLTLPRHFEYLVNAFLENHPFTSTIKVLDIGCGTGLSAELLLNTVLGERIAHIDLLDTSDDMLRRCGQRPSLSKISKNLIQGTLDALPAKPAYDVIMTCSVLHHIPDLDTFFRQLRPLHRPGGMFLHLQDPNGDYMNDPELRHRTEEFEGTPTSPAWMKKLTPQRVFRKVRAVLTGQQPRSYIDMVNEDLMRAGVIRQPLTDNEIWSVTDIQIYNGKGISIKSLAKLLPSYKPAATRSYSFFGTMHSELSPAFQQREDRLLESHAPNGLHIAAAWWNAGSEVA